MVLEKGVKQFKRMRSILVRKFGFVFWKEISIEDTLKHSLIKIEKRINSEEELLELC